MRRIDLNRRVARQHLLRGIYELIEADDVDAEHVGAGSGRPGDEALAQRPASITDLLAERSWTPRQLNRALARGEREGLVLLREPGRAFLTTPGLHEARRLVRNHRLWEIYLITHADIAPSHVDRDADALEHVIGREMVARLEAILAGKAPVPAVPTSPHVIGALRGGAA